ncbi:hypothetical protein [Pedobacter mucosus]|uniref:hypothetical protein n=1 Tax=Pedobacter mucosus TaxID=2895286 RepID=UPI001EE4D89C|nr:hypothetical protein [Pedobacter mucosus]UKT65102.1 hypothetical protein LOK61_04820 [Pedobacter mucosus]
MTLNSIPSTSLIQIFKTAAIKGAAQAMKKNVCYEESLKKCEAYKQFGRVNVDRWIKEGLLTKQCKPYKNRLLNKDDLKKIASSSNRITYLTVENRR